MKGGILVCIWQMRWLHRQLQQQCIFCSAAAGGYSVRQVRALNEPKKVPVMGVMGAFVFATQMINFTIPGTGSSGHLCGGMLLSALLGPYAGDFLR